MAIEAEEKAEDLAKLESEVSYIYWHMGQLDRALEFQLKAVAIMQQLFPNGHPNLDVMKLNLAIIKMQQKRI